MSVFNVAQAQTSQRVVRALVLPVQKDHFNLTLEWMHACYALKEATVTLLER